MRRKPTAAESRLYDALLVDLMAYDVVVKSQEPISYYIADFIIYPRRIVIEVDGGYHRTPKQMAYDRRRDSAFCALGITTIRIQNQRVFSDMRGVLEEIREALGEMKFRVASSGTVQITYCPPAYARGGRNSFSKINYLAAYNHGVKSGR